MDRTPGASGSDEGSDRWPLQVSSAFVLPPNFANDCGLRCLWSMFTCDQQVSAISEGAASEMHDTTGIAASIVVHFSNADRHPAAPVKVGHGDLLKGQVHGKRE